MNRIFLIFVCLSLSATCLTAQQPSSVKYLLTLEEVIEIAKEQSPQAILARHSFRASYFNFISYKATFLPKLTLTTQPTTYNKSIETTPSFDSEGNYVTREVKRNTFTSTAGLALSQNIGFTGGSISLGSDFRRTQNFLEKNSDATTSFTTTPVSLSISQPLNGYNRFRWDKQIEPLLYEEAKQSYIVAMENVSWRAVDNFFSLAMAQVRLNIAQTNLKNTEELYNVTQGRYNLGTVAEDDLLRVELSNMLASSSLNSATVEIESARSQLRSFLGFRDNVEIELLIDPEIPGFKVDYEEALMLALTRNPDIISYNRQILEAEQRVAQAKSQYGITLNLEASLGTNKTGYTFNEAYSPRFDDKENIGLRITVPILDWSQSRNRYRQAQSQLEVTESRMQQQETTFRQNIFIQVMSFNLQENQLRIAAKSDTIAKRSYDISYQRYLAGKGTVTDLNLADKAKDDAKLGYYSALRTFWTLFYSVRQLTLFDFQNKKPLEEDFDLIIGD